MRSIFDFLKKDYKDLYLIAKDFERIALKDIKGAIEKSNEFTSKLTKVIAEEVGLKELNILTNRERYLKLYEFNHISNNECKYFESIQIVLTKTIESQKEIDITMIHYKMYELATSFFINYVCFWFEPCYKRLINYRNKPIGKKDDSCCA
ncbi:MAG: hypothetical protein ACRC7N_05995 [Clostridium sp.]